MTTSSPEVAVESSAVPVERDVRRHVSWSLVILVIILIVGAVVRLFRIDALGYNSDEAVYGGQAAGLAGNSLYTDFFPVFRAHPMLVQVLLSPLFRSGEVDVAGRMVIAVLGVVTVLVVYLIGRDLYSRNVGLLAAGILAVMSYHVLPTRQMLLDGPMTLLVTLALLTLARYALTGRGAWLITSGAMLGLAMLCKETAVVMLGAYYAFFALAASVVIKWRSAVTAFVVFAAIFAIHPITSALAGGGSKSKSYLTWQLLREPNHEWTFYPTVVTQAIGLLVIVAALGGVWWCRKHNSWREILLLSWIAVPAVAFQLWPVKGFQYILPIAAPMAVLAARGLLGLPLPGSWPRPKWIRTGVVSIVVLSLAVPTAQALTSAGEPSFLAGTGGVPGGREAGQWIAENTPEGSTVLTLGPSMANIVQYYGHRKAYGLSVSPNPLRRNPSYEPVVNPDRSLRYSEIQYVVWDAYSANRSEHFSESLMKLVRRYNGHVIHLETLDTTNDSGETVKQPVIVVYGVWSLPAAPKEKPGEQGNKSQ